MQLTLRDDLIMTRVTVVHHGREAAVDDVVVDTGSATTLLAADVLARVGIVPEPADVLYTVRGVGGAEVVFSRRVDRLQIGSRALEQFEVEVGGMDYGFAINGILGMDFLLATGAIINLSTLSLDFTPAAGRSPAQERSNRPSD
jgi:hypothetical protein